LSNSGADVVGQEPTESSPVYLQILRVLYAPHKVFREVGKEPKYLVPILILVFFIFSSALFGYVILSKSYVEETYPKVDLLAGQFDVWTSNATLWTSSPNANISVGFKDFVNGSYYDNSSLEFSARDTSNIHMKLVDVGPINCSSPEGFKNVSLRVKFVDPETLPSYASIYLYSGEDSKYFHYNLTGDLLNCVVGAWNNLTIPLADKNWVSHDGDWSNITGLDLEFGWPKDSNIRVLIDGIFFRGLFENQIRGDPTGYLFIVSLLSILQFFIKWFTITGLIYILSNMLGARMVWKPISVSVGLVLFTLFIQNVINAAVATSTLPNTYYTLEYFGGTMTEKAAAVTRIDEQILLFSTIANYIQMAVFMWITILCMIATRSLTGLSWTKSAIAGVIASFVAFMLGLFIGI